ncbi:MAG: UDP-N-acetylmuramoyl-tripeptide--D-alanyl-D-alanine ligase [Cytophagales bacterium]|jgi:UDP-N-acetylmuramoyl-tripeptide--D-alanyl-D-alanine ligase|nr:UDP-N-acetylmuramoyl-tripeptide--D-alanyl-D-alanine ligase [Bacteroidota bacterium]MBS1980656.1 UDP-N-acetylmuramoyl-tripeptide--D-alanyl-D-alanine ligase [Bacteroidota bacterium]WHZ07982.1 MAG: UDP-N-acetylmuramoyl-tripeptide--D-alanyl-D-alanine ligase [Cytophagales bacterium]
MISIEQVYEVYKTCGSVCTDTRKIIPGSIFFALKGPNFNANTFAAEALQKGAAYAIIDDPVFATNNRCVLVDDGLSTLQQLARYHRNQLKIPVIGLTGSNGKTTSKELLNVVLQTKYKTFATQGNLNNHIGVPISVLSIKPDTEIAVIEMGANRVGDIHELVNICCPTHGFITNIGKAHIGTFGGFENIVKEKSELYRYLAKHNGQVFINSHDSILKSMAGWFKSPLLYSSKGDYFFAELISADPFIKYKAEQGEEVQTQLLGAYNFDNISSALCIGKFFGIEMKAANRAIAHYKPENMRSQVFKKETNTIILDAYNANPSSMKAAIENLSLMHAPNKVVILGDMFELENEAAEEHRLIGQLLREKNIQRIYLVGSLFKSAIPEIPFANYFKTKEELAAELKRTPITHSTILVKASRGIGLESIIEFL